MVSKVSERNRVHVTCKIQRKAARFVTGNYDQTMSVTGMLQDLKWDTLETMRRHARLCYGFQDGKWEDYLIPSRGRTENTTSHDLKFIVPKGHKDIFRFSLRLSKDNNWMEQSPQRNCHKPIPVYF